MGMGWDGMTQRLHTDEFRNVLGTHGFRLEQPDGRNTHGEMVYVMNVGVVITRHQPLSPCSITEI